MKKIITIIALAALCGASSPAQRIPKDDPAEKPSLRKTATTPDDAFGVLDKGELINILGNQGMIADSYYQNLIYNFRWPKSKGVANPNLGDVNAVDDVSLMFACKGNVVATSDKNLASAKRPGRPGRWLIPRRCAVVLRMQPSRPKKESTP